MKKLLNFIYQEVICSHGLHLIILTYSIVAIIGLIVNFIATSPTVENTQEDKIQNNSYPR